MVHKKCRKCEKITEKLQTKCDQNGTLLKLGIPAKRKGRQLFNKISKISGSNHQIRSNVILHT